MGEVRRRVFGVLLRLSMLAGAAELIVFVLAFTSLASGPSIEGYGCLHAGSQALPWFAALVVATVFAGVRMDRVRFGVGGLALASGFFGAAVGSMWGIGGVLANYDAVHQPPELNSLLLAFWTSSVIIAPTAIVLAVGAALLAATGAFVRWISLESYDRAVVRNAQSLHEQTSVPSSVSP